MAEVKKYISFEALKSDKNSGKAQGIKDIGFSEFEAFLKKLQKEYFKQNNTKTGNERQSDR